MHLSIYKYIYMLQQIFPTYTIYKHVKYIKISISALLTMPMPLTMWITINCGNSSKDGRTRPTDLPLEKPVCRSGNNS